MAKTSAKDEVQPIIIKKVKKGGHGHHGGAWKVAYADFVTAMMAFFLLLWLLNVVTEDELKSISSYFDPTPTVISEANSGAGGLMGGQAVSPDGALVTQTQPLTQPQTTGKAGKTEATFDNVDEESLEKLEEELRKQEDKQFEKAKAELEKQIKENPELAELAKNLMIDVTPEGLRIQLVDQDGKPMFPSGSAEMYDYTRKLMKAVSGAVKTMPNEVSVRGHTDSQQYAPGARYTNWELSSDRANTSRRALLEDGVAEKRLANVMGKADKEHLITENPADPRNRRISIILLRETVEQAMDRGAFGDMPKKDPAASNKPKKPVGTFQKTPGKVYFP